MLRSDHPVMQRLTELLSNKQPSVYVAAGVDPTTGVVSKDVIINADTGLVARLYLPPNSENKKLPIVVFYHGGGFILPNSPASYHLFVNTMVSITNVVCISASYRYWPEARLPTAYEDSLEALKWVFSKADPWLVDHGDFGHVFLAGDSAGANISHNLALHYLGGPDGEGITIEGVALLCPYFYGLTPIGTEGIEAITFLLNWAIVMGPPMQLDDPKMNPIVEGAPSLAGLQCKKAFVVAASEDQLVWRARSYWEALENSGWKGEPTVKEYPEEGHVFFLDVEKENSKDLFARLADFFNLKE